MVSDTAVAKIPSGACDFSFGSSRFFLDRRIERLRIPRPRGLQFGVEMQHFVYDLHSGISPYYLILEVATLRARSRWK